MKKIQVKLPSNKAAIKTKCFVPVRTFHTLRMTKITNQSLHTPTVSMNNNIIARYIGIRSFGTESETATNKTDPSVLHRQVTVAITEKDFSKAVNLLEKLKDLTQDDKMLQDVYEKLGYCYHGLAKLTEAIAAYEQSLAFARKLNDNKKITKSLSLLGGLQVAAQDFDNGNATLKEGLRLATEIKDAALRGHINSSLGISFANQQIPDAAIKYYMDSLEDFKEARNVEVVQRITRLIAQEYAKMKAFELSNSYWEQYLKFTRNTEDSQGQFKALDQIAKNFMRISKPRDSKITFEKALSLAKQMQSTELQRECLIGLAKACEVLGETAQAKKYSNEALMISKDDMDVQGEINALIVRATQSVTAKEFESCTQDAEKILELSVKHKHKSGEMYARILLGAVAEQQQEWTTAKDQFEKGLALAKLVKDAQSTKRCQDVLTVIYLNLRDFSTPLPMLHDLLKSYETDKDDIGRLRILSRVYLCYKNLGKQQHAEIYMKLCNMLANQLVQQGVIPSLDHLKYLLPQSTA